MAKHEIEIHTSDRQLFKRCRRKWGWQSQLRDNLIRIGPDHKAFFLGTGFHFALEDWFGYRRFPHPAMAFAAYYDAQRPADKPDEAEEALELGSGMLMYYIDEWLVEHPDEYETLWVPNAQTGRDEPQVEVEVKIDITDLVFSEAEEIDGRDYREVVEEWLDGKRVVYVTTYDRVVIDSHDRLWGMDYKTAAQFDELNLQTNPQAGSYDWSMDLFYTPVGFKPEGIIWQQHKKVVPADPATLAKGGFSLDKRQSTTYRRYRRALLDAYSTIPARYNSILAELADRQDHDGDNFIRRDWLRRNAEQRRIEQEKIVAEVLEMLDPDLPLYPNPTERCGWDCPFKAPCLALDDGGDHEHILNSEYTQWAGYKDDWRKRVKYPSASEPTEVLVGV